MLSAVLCYLADREVFRHSLNYYYYHFIIKTLFNEGLHLLAKGILPNGPRNIVYKKILSRVALAMNNCMFTCTTVEFINMINFVI